MSGTTPGHTMSQQLYTPKSLFTLGGATLAVYLGSSVCGFVMDFNPRWLGLALAMVVAFVGLARLPRDEEGPKPDRMQLLVVAMFNGFLIYANAVGLDTLNHAGGVEGDTPSEAALIPFGDTGRWWQDAETQEQLVATERVLDWTAEDNETLREGFGQVTRAVEELDSALGPPGATGNPRKQLNEVRATLDRIRPDARAPQIDREQQHVEELQSQSTATSRRQRERKALADSRARRTGRRR